MIRKILGVGILGLIFPIHLMAKTPAVAVDIAPVHSLVSQVMAGVSTPTLIIPAEASPHDYSLRPSQAEALAEADVVFWIGESLTPWLSKSLDNLASSAKKIELLDVPEITTYEYRAGANFGKHEHHDEHEKHHDDHEKNKGGHHGHHHEGLDPHAWLDPENAKVWLMEINRVLKVADPINANSYQRNTDAAVKAMDQLIQDSRRKLNAIGEIKFVVFHDAYQYFERRFDKLATGSISLGDAQDPSPARIAEIKETVQRYGVNCAFSEPQYNPGLVNAVFENSVVASIGIMDPLGATIEIGVNHYDGVINGMVKSLSTCAKR